MDHREASTVTHYDFDEIDLGFAVSLMKFREALNTASTNGQQWFIATDPCEAVESRSLRVGYGDENSIELLSKIYFRLPVLSESLPRGGASRIVILLDASCCISDQPGFYVAGDGQIKHDFLQDFVSFFYPLKKALIDQMQTGD